MAYYTKVLQPGETVKYVASLHWIIYRHAIGLFLIAVVVALFAMKLSDDKQWFALIGAAAVAVLALGSFIHSWFQQWIREIVVTDRRVISKKGFIARTTQEMNITKVETVDVRQSFWGRILGFGEVDILGTGAGIETLKPVASPLELRNAIIVG